MIQHLLPRLENRSVTSAGVMRFSGLSALTLGLLLAVRTGLSSWTSFSLASSGGYAPPDVLQWSSVAVGVLVYLAVLGTFGGLYLHSLLHTGRSGRGSLRFAGHAGVILCALLIPVVVVTAVLGNSAGSNPDGATLAVWLDVAVLHGIPLALLLVSLYALQSLAGVWKILPLAVSLSFSPVTPLVLTWVLGGFGGGLGMISAGSPFYVVDLGFLAPTVLGALASLALGYAALTGRARRERRYAR